MWGNWLRSDWYTLGINTTKLHMFRNFSHIGFSFFFFCRRADVRLCSPFKLATGDSLANFNSSVAREAFQTWKIKSDARPLLSFCVKKKKRGVLQSDRLGFRAAVNKHSQCWRVLEGSWGGLLAPGQLLCMWPWPLTSLGGEQGETRRDVSEKLSSALVFCLFVILSRKKKQLWKRTDVSDLFLWHQKSQFSSHLLK